MKQKVRTRYQIFLFRLFCCLFALNLEGCVFWGEKTWSDLNPTGFNQNENGVLHLQELGVDIYAGNRDTCSAPIGFIGILIPIIPVPCFLKDTDWEFRIAIKILPEVSDFSFDPRKVKITVRGKKYSPNKFTITGIPRRRTISDKPRKLPPLCQYHEKIQQHDRLAYDKIYSEHMSIPNGLCISLTFPTVPPKPQEEFFITLNGLTKKGKPFFIPPIYFVTQSEWYFSLLRN